MLDILFFFVQFGILTPKMGILTYESHARNFVNKMGTHILWAPNMAPQYGLPKWVIWPTIWPPNFRVAATA